MESRPSVFVDANVFLDVLWKNKGWESSLEVIEKVRRGEIKGFVSVLTIAIIYFFLLTTKGMRVALKPYKIV